MSTNCSALENVLRQITDSSTISNQVITFRNLEEINKCISKNSTDRFAIVLTRGINPNKWLVNPIN